MSKNHQKQGSGSAHLAEIHAGEYQIIKHDLVKVVVLNLIYLAAILALFFTNSKTHYLENWFSKILHF